MSRKFKKLVHSVSEKAGVSHAGAVNLLRRGSRRPLSPLDPVLIRSGARPDLGKHTHEAGIVSAVCLDGTVVVTPAAPRRTLGGLSFWQHEKPVRYRSEDVRHFPLKKGERFAKFVESLFPEVSYSREEKYADADIPWLFEKSLEDTAYIVGEEAESILAVMKPRRVAIPLWEVRSDLVIDDEVVGQDALRNLFAIRDRMLALMDCTQFSRSSEERRHLSSPPDGVEWYVADVDDSLSRDQGMVLDRPPLLWGRYVCGKGKIGRHVVTSSSRGLLLLESDVSIVIPPRP